VTWAKLAYLASGRALTYVNTHFDYHPPAIAGDALVLGQWLDRIREETPLIITGDFNADKDSKAYRTLTEGGGMIDAFRQVQPQGTDEATYHAYGRGEEMAAIDWILVSGHFRVLAADIDRSRQGNLFPSDHYPLTSVLDWQG
jgi:endonuclease/exonuclease/phosphatase family metal-dependent hydrolase